MEFTGKSDIECICNNILKHEIRNKDKTTVLSDDMSVEELIILSKESRITSPYISILCILKIINKSTSITEVYEVLLDLISIVDNLHLIKSIPNLLFITKNLVPDRHDIDLILLLDAYDRASDNLDYLRLLYQITNLELDQDNLTESQKEIISAIKLRSKIETLLLSEDDLTNCSSCNRNNHTAVRILIQSFRSLGMVTNLTQFDRINDVIKSEISDLIKFSDKFIINSSIAMQDLYAMICCNDDRKSIVEISSTITNIKTLVDSEGFNAMVFSSDPYKSNMLNLEPNIKAFVNISIKDTMEILKHLSESLEFGYLSVDSNGLKSIDLKSCKFNCITVHHCGNSDHRQLIQDNGYILLCKDVRSNYGEPPEDDWYISKDLLEKYPILKNIECDGMFAKDILIEKI